MAHPHTLASRVFATGIAGLLFMTSGGVHAGGFALIEQSVSSMGTAYAQGSSGIDDASTIYFNPAGMTRLPGRNVSGAVHIVHSDVDFTGSNQTNPFNPAYGPGQPLDGLGGIADTVGAGSTDLGLTQPVPHFGYSHQHSERLWFGVSVNTPFGLKTDYDSNWVGRYHADLSELITININPSVAFRIDDHASIGFGVSAMYADAELTNWVNGGLFTGAPYTNDLFAKVVGDDWGFGFNFGLLIEPSSQTRLGIHYRSKVNLELEGDYSGPDSPLTPIVAPLAPITLGASAEVTLPGTLSLSAHHDVNNQWAVMADVTWTEWSRLDSLIIERSGGAAPIISVFDWDDNLRYAVGATYRHNPTWLFRAGLAFDETPIKSAELRTARVPGEDRTWLTFGFNYRYSQDLSFDIGYAHLFVDDPKINSPDAHTPPLTTGLHLLTGEYDAAVDMLSAQVNWKFD
jgi:long-chain fatty acid transport protein